MQKMHKIATLNPISSGVGDQNIIQSPKLFKAEHFKPQSCETYLYCLCTLSIWTCSSKPNRAGFTIEICGALQIDMQFSRVEHYRIQNILIRWNLQFSPVEYYRFQNNSICCNLYCSRVEHYRDSKIPRYQLPTQGCD